MHEGFIEMPQSLLQGHRRNIGEPHGIILLFQFGQHSTQILVGQTLAVLVVSIGFLSQRPIVDIATTSKGLGKKAFLFIVWVKPILVGSFLFHGLLFISYSVDCQELNIAALSSPCLQRQGPSHAAFDKKNLLTVLQSAHNNFRFSPMRPPYSANFASSSAAFSFSDTSVGTAAAGAAIARGRVRMKITATVAIIARATLSRKASLMAST